MCSNPFPLGDFTDPIVERTMKLSDNESLKHLQLVCRDFRRIGRIVLAKRFMGRRVHMFTKHSLETLVKISSIPIYARHVKEISLGCCRISAEHLEYAEAFPDMHDIEPIHPGGPIRNALRYARQVQASQDAIQDTGVGMDLLVTAMRNFSIYSNNLGLGIWQDVGEYWQCTHHNPLQCDYRDFPDNYGTLVFSGYGSRQLVRDLEGGVLRDGFGEATKHLVDNYAIFFETRPNDTMRLLMDAAAQASCRNDSLSLCINRQALDSSNLRVGLLKHIRTMHIAVQWNTDGHTPEHCEIVQNAIANAEGLETLTLTFARAIPYLEIRRQVSTIAYFSLYFGMGLVTPDSTSCRRSLRSLRNLTLANAQASQDQWIRLLTQAPQLDCLELLYCIPVDGSWMRVLEWIAINLPMLSRFQFTAMDVGKVHVDPKTPTFIFVPYYFDGVQAVRDGLQYLLRKGDAHLGNTRVG